MNTTELESILKKARLPEPPPDSLEMFPRQVMAGLKRDVPRAPGHRGFPLKVAWASGLAACLLLAVAIGGWPGRWRNPALPPGDILANARFSAETLTLFPNRLRAIIEDAQGLRLDLSESDNVPASPPLYIHICDGEHCSSFVTFSGQEIKVDGQTVSVLCDTHGGIILAGDQFVWTNTKPMQAGDHLKIEARVLGAVVL